MQKCGHTIEGKFTWIYKMFKGIASKAIYILLDVNIFDINIFGSHVSHSEIRILVLWIDNFSKVNSEK